MQLIVHHVKDQLKKVRGQRQGFTYGLCKLKFLIVFEACQEMSSCSIFILLPCPAPFMSPYHVPPISVASTSGEDGVCSDKCGRLIVHGVCLVFVWLQVEAAHRPAQWRQASRLCSHPAIRRKVTSERHAHCHQVCGCVPASLFSFLLHSIPPLPLSGTRKQNVMILCSSQTDWVVSSWSSHSHYYHSRLLLLHQTPHSCSLTFSLLLPLLSHSSSPSIL